MLRIFCLLIFTAFLATVTSCGDFAAAGSVWESDDVILEVDNGLRKYGLELLGPDHPAFETELQKYLVENRRHAAAINEAKRSGILIKNNADREVVGVSLLWTMSGSKGTVIPQSPTHPGALMGMKALDPAMIGKTSLINVGATRFFSYSGAGEDARIGVVSLGIGGSPPYPVSVKLDGVFFDDGSFVGENKSFYFEQVSGSVKAHLDFATRLVESQRAGKSDSQIIDEFLVVAPKDFPTPTWGIGGYSKNAEETFDLTYVSSMFNFRRELEWARKAGRTDQFILSVHSRGKMEDFKTLKRIDQATN